MVRTLNTHTYADYSFVLFRFDLEKNSKKQILCKPSHVWDRERKLSRAQIFSKSKENDTSRRRRRRRWRHNNRIKQRMISHSIHIWRCTKIAYNQIILYKYIDDFYTFKWNIFIFNDSCWYLHDKSIHNNRLNCARIHFEQLFGLFDVHFNKPIF